MIENNPLLAIDKLPQFGQIQACHIESSIDFLLADNRQKIQLLLDQDDYTWQNLLAPLEHLNDRLGQVWGIVNHLHAVADNPDLRKAYHVSLPKVTAYTIEIQQLTRLFNACECLRKNSRYESLTPVQKKVVENSLRDFRLAGVDLDDETKNRYKEIQEQLSALETKFEENLLDATDAWHKDVRTPELLSGLPESLQELIKQDDQNQKDIWRLSLQFPIYSAVMKYADDRSLREQMYRAYVTRASGQGYSKDWDNTQIMVDILQRRRQKVKLLGFENYAHYSLATKMADSVEEVLGFLTDLAQRSRSMAELEFAELSAFAKDLDDIELQAWDMAYYSEKLKHQKFAVSDQLLRDYFPVEHVLDGLFMISKKLYGISIKQRSQIDAWHDDVLFFDVFDSDEQLIAGFYLDIYARTNKRGGAWMAECMNRSYHNQKLKLPITYLSCNFEPPSANRPTLLTHNEVITLFHEFGHGLHHMLTKVDCASVAGINGVAWDAVELPSQLLENWCWEKPALDLFARHFQTQASMDEALFSKFRQMKQFQSGMQMLRQIEFALFDFRLHLLEINNADDITAILSEIRSDISVVPTPDFNCFQHSFSHIFAGGYAAGYYSYKWAEVLAADAFSLFEEQGIFDQKTGKAFMRHILEKGGSVGALDLFVAFRGRKPKIDALLNQAGIVAT